MVVSTMSLISYLMASTVKGQVDELEERVLLLELEVKDLRRTLNDYKLR
jgi:hypothetical protein